MSVSDVLTMAISGEYHHDAALPLWGMLLVVLGFMAIPMGPAEPTVIMAGTLAPIAGIPLWLIIPVVALGMFLGDLITFLAAGGIRTRILHSPRLRHRVHRWQHQLTGHRRWRDLSILSLRFVPGARTLAALAARSTDISTGRFCLLTLIGATLWATAWISIASVIERIPLVALVFIGIGLLVAMFWQSRRRRISVTTS